MLDFDMFGPVWQERSASGEVGASNVGLTIGSTLEACEKDSVRSLLDVAL